MAAASPVQDPVPIGPNQYFMGLVNGHPPGQAIIDVACAVGAATGHPTGHQPVEVETASPTSPADLGYTGSKGDRIKAALGTSTAAIVIGSFTSYYVKKFIPTKISVPCSGSGTVAFIPSPGSKTAHTATLAVTFGSITG
jgi:hypothetical protein